MPKDGDKPGPCCEGMEIATAEGNQFMLRWCVDEMNYGPDEERSFTGWGIEINVTGWYPGEHDSEFAPVKFCPFCGAELKG